jgi:hypothetical protein
LNLSATVLVTLAAASVDAAACELEEFFGLRLAEPVPPALVTKKGEMGSFGIMRVDFKPKVAQAPFAPLEGYVTGKRYLLVTASGSYRKESAAAARESLRSLLADLTAQYGCRFREDRQYIMSYPQFDAKDVEVQVSIGSKTVAVVQRDGTRVVLRLRSLGLIEIVKQDPPEE